MPTASIEAKFDEVKLRSHVQLAGLVDCEEAAAILGVSGRRVRHFLAEGRLKGIKVGRTWLIKKAEVLEFATMERKPGRPIEAD